jgi:hypothetical protein
MRMWMTLLEIGKYCFGEKYRGCSITDYHSNKELFLSKKDLESIKKRDQDPNVIQMGRRAKILSSTYQYFLKKELVREKVPNSVDFILND